jgi:hypothetical protein
MPLTAKRMKKYSTTKRPDARRMKGKPPFNIQHERDDPDRRDRAKMNGGSS